MQLNILFDELPDFAEINGKRYHINTDFKVWIKIDSIIFESDSEDKSKMLEILKLSFSDGKKGRILPPTLNTASQAIIDFYSGPKNESCNTKGQSFKNKRSFSFLYDSELIFSAFYEQYGIDLTEASMHWWKFLALLYGLNENTRLMQVLKIRCIDISDIRDKRLKQYYKKMKRSFALPDKRSDDEIDGSLAEELISIFE